jgi:hypothetical protein
MVWIPPTEKSPHMTPEFIVDMNPPIRMLLVTDTLLPTRTAELMEVMPYTIVDADILMVPSTCVSPRISIPETLEI